MRTALSTLVLVILAVPAVAHARTDLIAGLSASEVRSSDGKELAPFGRGGGASILIIDEVPEPPLAGFEASTLFLVGADGERLYDLGLTAIFGPRVHGPITPYLALGLDLAAATVPDPGEAAIGADDRGVGIGVHGGVGAYGVVDKFFWRAQVGWLGAGPGGVLGTLTVGYVVGDL